MCTVEVLVFPLFSVVHETPFYTVNNRELKVIFHSV